MYLREFYFIRKQKLFFINGNLIFSEGILLIYWLKVIKQTLEIYNKKN